MRSTSRVAIDLRFSVCGTGFEVEVELSTASASRSRSTIPASAAACWPTSERESPSPIVPAVLPIFENSEAESEFWGFLRAQYKMSMGEWSGR
jgi:hypothetical protein